MPCYDTVAHCGCDSCAPSRHNSINGHKATTSPLLTIWMILAFPVSVALYMLPILYMNEIIYVLMGHAAHDVQAFAAAVSWSIAIIDSLLLVAACLSPVFLLPISGEADPEVNAVESLQGLEDIHGQENRRSVIVLIQALVVSLVGLALASALLSLFALYFDSIFWLLTGQTYGDCPRLEFFVMLSSGFVIGVLLVIPTVKLAVMVARPREFDGERGSSLASLRADLEDETLPAYDSARLPPYE